MSGENLKDGHKNTGRDEEEGGGEGGGEGEMRDQEVHEGSDRLC